MKRLTTRQERLAKARIKYPRATLKVIGQKVGKSDPAHVHRELAKPHVKAYMKQLMDASPKLRLPAVLKKLEEGLDATEVKLFSHEGEIIESAPMIDYSTRHKYLETALECHGAKEAKGSGPSLSINVLFNGGGSPAEREQTADVLLKARLDRGLHPLESRPIRPEERKQFEQGGR